MWQRLSPLRNGRRIGSSAEYRADMASPLVRAAGARDRVVDTAWAVARWGADTETVSWASTSSRFSVLSHSSLFSIGAVGSFASAGSILSVGSTGSILSIGSVGSILSIGSAGSVLSIGSAGRVAAVGQGPSTSGQPTVPRIDGTRDRSAAVGRTLALLALAAAALGR